MFDWEREDFENKMQGSAIYRIGYERWMRNIAVALGNYLRSESIDALSEQTIKELLTKKVGKISDLVDEHIAWALDF